jgi:predicted RNase H-like HicB family nuclease
MSGRSRRSSRARAIDAPFAPAVLKRAREIADSYQIILHFEDGEYYGRGLELPSVMNDGRTPDECVRHTRDILTTTIAYMLENGETPPPPASEGKRTEQVNIRLTPEEKLLLEETAKSRGFRGVSDFVRAQTLSNLR